MNDKIYLKIYSENDNKVLVFEGQGSKDEKGYYPQRWDDETRRIGTVVIGAEHIRITKEAKDLFKKLVNEAQKTGDDISCIDIHKCYSQNKQSQICVSYLGQVVERINVEEAINNEDFFIGTGEGYPELELLEEIPLI